MGTKCFRTDIAWYCGRCIDMQTCSVISRHSMAPCQPPIPLYACIHAGIRQHTNVVLCFVAMSVLIAFTPTSPHYTQYIAIYQQHKAFYTYTIISMSFCPLYHCKMKPPISLLHVCTFILYNVITYLYQILHHLSPIFCNLTTSTLLPHSFYCL